MKHVQFVDGADNCTYEIYALTDEEFAVIFPNETDVELIEDAILRVGEERVTQIADAMWTRRVDKKRLVGIHGTLFYELQRKAAYYPTKKEAEATSLGH